MATCIVPPGEFVVTADSSTILETSLGSCVGVALYDAEAKVGGMLHVLLPAGSVFREKMTPSRFARSGVPLLLSEMVKLGALKERIKGTIAGGALVLTDKVLSVEMNIGRRNSEMVLGIMERERIPVLEKEIGGHAPRLLRIVLATGETNIELVGQRREDQTGCSSDKPIGYPDLKLKIDGLKPLPEIARRILLRVNQAEFNVLDLERDILKDQALTANVLKMCNSAQYGFSRRVSSIRRALGLIGVNGLLEIVLATFSRTLYKHNVPGYSIKKGQLMQHSVSCGLVAELIAQEKKTCDPSLALTAGLLHDIGKVILDQYAFEKFNLIMDKVLNERMGFLDAESEILGFNHAQVGGMVAKEWNLPDELIDAISLHHAPEAYRVDPMVVCTVHLADNICSMFGDPCGADSLSNRIHQFAITTLNLQKGDVERIIERLPEVVRQLEMIC